MTRSPSSARQGAREPVARRARQREPWTTARKRRLKVAELFVSLQGEGSRAGWRTAFLRLTGCALRCRWCDTEWAFREGSWISLERLARSIAGFESRRVCVTGGEPLLQPSVVPLIRHLAEDLELEVVVETGGDQDISVLPRAAIRVLDIKLPGSGMQRRFDVRNVDRLDARDEVKLVIADRADYDAAVSWVRGPLAGFAGEIIVSPVHESGVTADLGRWVLEDRLPVRVQIQLHKVIWPGESRGV